MFGDIFNFISNHYNVVGIIASTGVALTYIFNKIIKPIVTFGIKVDKLNDSLPVLLQIAKEFSSNGGSSIKDRVQKTEIALNTLVQTIEDNKSVDLKQRDDILHQVSELKDTLKHHVDDVDKIQIQLNNITQQLENIITGKI